MNPFRTPGWTPSYCTKSCLSPSANQNSLNPIRHWSLPGLAIGGAWIAERLARDLGLPNYGVINVAFHRDDYAEKGLAAMRSADSMATHLPFEVAGAHIVLIDDVLLTGRTVRAALNELFDFGRPASVELMVLADRGKRELPIAADFVGEHCERARPPDTRIRKAWFRCTRRRNTYSALFWRNEYEYSEQASHAD